MVEMANPGLEGLQYLGRDDPKNLKNLNGQQQISPLVYKHLSKNILKEEEYGVFGNVLVDGNVVTQATYWKKSSYSSLTVAVGLNMMHEGGGRPISALFFASEKTLILNVHSVHFRKTLISAPAAFGPRIQKRISKFKTAGMRDFSTKDLRKLYGFLLTYKIVEALKSCGVSAPNVTTGTYCQGEVGSLIDKPLEGLAKKMRQESWTIIAGGDFNDETMELSTFKIFGITVSVADKQRKRTCCSDRDPDFKQAMTGEKDENDVHIGIPLPNPLNTPIGHTIANLDYMVKSGYLHGSAGSNLSDAQRASFRLELQRFIIEEQQNNPISLPGARKILADGSRSESFSPFPSDMILSNRRGGAIEFPPGYKQRMSQRTKSDLDNYKVKKAPKIKMWEYDSMISDHDPIERLISR